MKYLPKRLIEIDLPIRRISEHARREKSIRHGHISTLHIWWARRPLAACRAVVCASLWPDPADENCPESFRKEARELMIDWSNKHENLSSNETFKRRIAWKKNPKKAESNVELRKALLDFIADFANWDNSTNQYYLETARILTQTAHEALGGEPGTRPLVVDPFAGGGAIPLEALRVGADAFASDLNPVAVLLNKVVLEYIPKYGQKLADEVRKWGAWIKERAEKELSEFYPKDPDGSTPIAYLWARTINCEGPGCGAEVPLIRSLWLAKKGSKSVALRIIPKPHEKRIDFEIIEGAKTKDVSNGTVARGSASCPCCGFTTPVARVRVQMKTRKGGAADARLFCVVTTRTGQQGRFYRLPTNRDLEAVSQASKELVKRKLAHQGLLSLVPDEPTPLGGGSGAGRAFSQRNYGMNLFEDLFTPRQALSLTTLVKYVKDISSQGISSDPGFSNAIQTCLAITLDRQADALSSLVRWRQTVEAHAGTFGRPALSMMWDFVEIFPFSGATGDWDGALNWVVEVLEIQSLALYHTKQKLDGGASQEISTKENVFAEVSLSSATHHPLPNHSISAFFTDPPYYDAIPYADLSDFFYVWLKRTLPKSVLSSFTEALTPKSAECIVDEVKGKNQDYFEKTMGNAMAEGNRILNLSGIGVVVFAHKSTSGWEAQLQAMIDAGWTMTGSWPIDTERPGRLRAQSSAALASSVHIVCRPRQHRQDACGNQGTNKVEATKASSRWVGDWRDVLSELPIRIHEWMPRLAEEGVVGADAIFACLGPALEIFSRYSHVEKASGEQVCLKEFLVYVWGAVAKEALNMIFTGADTSGFEEDARLTAMWLWTLNAGSRHLNEGVNEDIPEDETAEDDDEEGETKPGKTTGFVLEFDAARKIAQGLGAHLEQLSTLIEVKGDKARLLPVSERTKALFGKDQAQSPASKKAPKMKQLSFEAILGEIAKEEPDWGEKKISKVGNTVLDRLHQTMILFAAGRSEAMKRFLVEDGIGRDDRFWRLAQALSALYPSNTDEKRWVDGVLARKKSLGF